MRSATVVMKKPISPSSSLRVRPAIALPTDRPRPTRPSVRGSWQQVELPEAPGLDRTDLTPFALKDKARPIARRSPALLSPHPQLSGTESFRRG